MPDRLGECRRIGAARVDDVAQECAVPGRAVASPSCTLRDELAPLLIIAVGEDAELADGNLARTVAGNRAAKVAEQSFDSDSDVDSDLGRQPPRVERVERCFEQR